MSGVSSTTKHKEWVRTFSASLANKHAAVGGQQFGKRHYQDDDEQEENGGLCEHLVAEEQVRHKR